MKCIMCKGGTLKEGVRNHVVTLKDVIIIIKGVPCTECTQCGESYYDNDVALELERIVKGITDNALTEIAVVAYPKSVA